jgi:hypothetical protein
LRKWLVYTIGECFSFKKLRTLKRNMFFTLKISIQRIWDDPTIFETRIKSNRNWYEKNLPLYHLSKKKKKRFTPLPLLPNLPLCEVVGCGMCQKSTANPIGGSTTMFRWFGTSPTLSNLRKRIPKGLKNVSYHKGFNKLLVLPPFYHYFSLNCVI